MVNTEQALEARRVPAKLDLIAIERTKDMESTWIVWAPAWVQAIGAIAAIAGGFVIVRMQSKEQLAQDMARERRADRRRVCALLEVLSTGEAVTVLAEEVGRRKDTKLGKNLGIATRDLRQLCHMMPIVEMPDPVTIRHFSLLMQALTTYETFAEKVLSGEVTEDNWASLESFAKGTFPHLKEAKSLCASILARLDAADAGSA